MAHVFDLLDEEWRRLSTGRPARGCLAEVRAVAGGARSLGEVERFVRAAHPADADRVLLALVRRTTGGDVLAGRVLLQLLLPGVRRLARRWWALGDADERAAAAVTAVYHRIRHYPVERRPGHVAANILLDAEQELRRAVPRLVTTPATDPAVPGVAHLARAVQGAAEHPSIELAEVLADAAAAGIVSRDDAELIARSRIAGERVDDIAGARGLRPRTLWDRRRRAEHALATARLAG